MTSWVFTIHRESDSSHTRYVPAAGVFNAVHVQGGPKTGLLLRVDNFAIVRNFGGRKACDMSTASKFSLEKSTKLTR